MQSGLDHINCKSGFQTSLIDSRPLHTVQSSRESVQQKRTLAEDLLCLSCSPQSQSPAQSLRHQIGDRTVVKRALKQTTRMTSNFSNYINSYRNLEAIMLYIIGFILIILIIAGNLLVIIAVVKDKTLKNLQNWFIGKNFC